LFALPAVVPYHGNSPCASIYTELSTSEDPLDKRMRSIEIFAVNLNGSVWKSL
jgi:hypothetical protein